MSELVSAKLRCYEASSCPLVVQRRKWNKKSKQFGAVSYLLHHLARLSVTLEKARTAPGFRVRIVFVPIGGLPQLAGAGSCRRHWTPAKIFGWNSGLLNGKQKIGGLTSNRDDFKNVTSFNLRDVWLGYVIVDLFIYVFSFDLFSDSGGTGFIVKTNASPMHCVLCL